MSEPVRWAVLGTANIARRSFLPGLRAAGGRAVVVGSRSPDRASGWASDNGVDRVATYEAAIDDPEVDAVYVALPNDQHLDWTARAVAAGKAVLCEKPFGLDAASVTDTVTACGPDAPAWEAFVFPFHPQTRTVQERIAAGAIGTVREVVSEFHFRLGAATNIRWDAERAGGALNDVGCYPLRLGRLLLGEPVRAAGLTTLDGGVDVTSSGVVEFAGGTRLRWSSSFAHGASTYTRIIGDEGELRLGNPFHPKPGDGVEVWAGSEFRERVDAPDGTAFEHGIRHLHDAIRGRTTPAFRIGDDAVAQAACLDLVRRGLTG